MVDYPLLYFLFFYGIKGTLILNSSWQQDKVIYLEKNARKAIHVKKTGKIQIRFLYFEVWPCSCQGCHYILWSSLLKSLRLYCSHLLPLTLQNLRCRRHSGGTWRSIYLQLKAGLSLELLAGIEMGSQNWLAFHVFLDDVLLVERTQP